MQVCRVSMEEDVQTSVMHLNADVPNDLWAIDVKLKVNDNKNLMKNAKIIHEIGEI